MNVQNLKEIKNYIEKAKIVTYTENKYSHWTIGGIEMYSLYPNLEAAMAKRGVSIGNLAELIGCSEEIVHLKMRGVREWSLLDAVTICRYLQYPDLKTLFLR